MMRTLVAALSLCLVACTQVSESEVFPTPPPGAAPPMSGLTPSSTIADGVSEEDIPYTADEMEERQRAVELAMLQLGWIGEVVYDLDTQRFRITITELSSLFGSDGTQMSQTLASILADPERPNPIEIEAYELRVIVRSNSQTNNPCRECSIR